MDAETYIVRQLSRGRRFTRHSSLTMLFRASPGGRLVHESVLDALVRRGQVVRDGDTFLSDAVAARPAPTEVSDG